MFTYHRCITNCNLFFLFPSLLNFESYLIHTNYLPFNNLTTLYLVGVEDPEERKKLYFLVQRLQKILSSKSNNTSKDGIGTPTKSKTGDENKESAAKAADELNSSSEGPLIPSAETLTGKTSPIMLSSSTENLGGQERKERALEESHDESKSDSLRESSDKSEDDLRVLRRRNRYSSAGMGRESILMRPHRSTEPFAKEVDEDNMAPKEKRMKEEASNTAPISASADDISGATTVFRRANDLAVSSSGSVTTATDKSLNLTGSVDRLSFKKDGKTTSMARLNRRMSNGLGVSTDSSIASLRSSQDSSLGDSSSTNISRNARTVKQRPFHTNIARAARNSTTNHNKVTNNKTNNNYHEDDNNNRDDNNNKDKDNANDMSLESGTTENVNETTATTTTTTTTTSKEIKSIPRMVSKTATNKAKRTKASLSSSISSTPLATDISSNDSGDELRELEDLQIKVKIERIDSLQRDASPIQKRTELANSTADEKEKVEALQVPVAEKYEPSGGRYDKVANYDNGGESTPSTVETDLFEDELNLNGFDANASLSRTTERLAEVEDMAIRVVVRKRPLSGKEMSRGDLDILRASDGGEIELREPKLRVDLTRVIEVSKFLFDDSFEAGDDNEEIYGRTVKPLVKFAFDGGKASCFAYGQTGSGKTHTLMGADPENPADSQHSAGLYVLAGREIFQLLGQEEFKHLYIGASCFEIYGGKLYDLLNTRNEIKCLEDGGGNVRMPRLKEITVAGVQELIDLMALAHDNRSVGSTGANEASSRSHLVMQLMLKKSSDLKNGAGGADDKISKNARRRSTFKELSKIEEELGPGGHGKITFIDLAGSERGADTTHNSKQTRMEGAEINTSLLALKEVIRALATKSLDSKGLNAGPRQTHTPFRGSKLTQVLKDSFVGEMTRTCMIACVSPAHSNCEHTLNTLRYADRVKEHDTNPDRLKEGAPQRRNSNNNGGVSSSQTDVIPTQNNNNRRRASAHENSPVRAKSPASRQEKDIKRPSTSSGVSQSVFNAQKNSPARNIPRPSTSSDVSRRKSVLPTSSSNGNGNGGIPRRGIAPSVTNKASSPARETSPARRERIVAEGVFTESDGVKAAIQSFNENNSANINVPENDENLNRTLSLLSAHKKSIADSVEVRMLSPYLFHNTLLSFEWTLTSCIYLFYLSLTRVIYRV